MQSTRVLVRWVAARDVPPLLRGEGRASPLGRWVLERVASLRLDWPTVAFLRAELYVRGLELLLDEPPMSGADTRLMVLAHAIGRELDVAARRRGWVTQALWHEVKIFRQP